MSGFAGKGVVIAGGGRGFALVCARLIADCGRFASLIGQDFSIASSRQGGFARRRWVTLRRKVISRGRKFGI